MIPPRVILAAVDLSDPSRAALVMAARLAQQCHASLHVLHAQDPALSDAARTRNVDLTEESREELQAFVRSVLPGPEGAACVRHVVAGPVTDVICNIADREQAHMIVIGAHGMSGVHRIFGSIAEGVIRCAAIPVLLVPAHWSPPRPEMPGLEGLGPLVVGVDLAEPALGAAAAAARLARTLDTTLNIVHVVPAPAVLPRWTGDAALAAERHVEAARRDLTTALEGLGPDAPSRLRVEIGPVAETLVRLVAARDDQHPLLVLGRRTRADRCGAPGSTAYRVLLLADVPVLVHVPDQET
jgi:nucleotide-binding universal stress UspA family protein